MLLVGKTGAIVAGVFGAAFIGYCIYFDRKRRSAPDFRAKLRETDHFNDYENKMFGWFELLQESKSNQVPLPIKGKDLDEKDLPFIDTRRRKQKKQDKENDSIGKLPDLKDVEAVQKFFLEEVQLGEELLARGDYEKGVDHLSNAVSVCGQPQQLLQVLQQTLPHPVFQMLIQRLPAVRQRFLAGMTAQNLVEDDVE